MAKETISTMAERDLLLSLLQEHLQELPSDLLQLPSKDEDVVAITDRVLNPVIRAWEVTSPGSDSVSPPFGDVSSPQQPPGTTSNGGSPIFLETNVVSAKARHQEKKKRTPTPSPVAKREKRAEQCREAARRYRQKKKALIGQLEEESKELTEQNERLMKEKQQAFEMVERLRGENWALQKRNILEAEHIERERLVAVKDLEELYKTGAGDAELLRVLARLKEICQRVNVLGQCHLALLMSPDTASHLATVGFFTSAASQVEIPTSKESMANFVKRVMSTVDNLTQEQIGMAKEIVKEHYLNLQLIDTERKEVTKDLDAFFASNLADRKSHTPTFDILAMVEYLRTNFQAECETYERNMERVVMTLTPRQRAQFYLTVESQHAAVTQLKAVWDSLKNIPATKRW